MKTPNAPRARSLRRGATEAEAALWELLRDRRLDGLKFRRQHAWRNFVLDFYCAQARLALELDGEGHLDAAQKTRDAERTRVLEACGISVLRFWNARVLAHPESVVNAIREVTGSPSSPLTPTRATRQPHKG